MFTNLQIFTQRTTLSCQECFTLTSINNLYNYLSAGYCEGTKIALAEPTGTLFGIGQKLDEVVKQV